MKDDLQKEMRKLLARLPDTPVASNFTARVMQAVDLEEARRPRQWIFNWRVFLPRAAAVAAVVLFAGLVIQHQEAVAQRAAFAKNLAFEAKTMPSVEALKNFNTIQRMSQPAQPDKELLALLQ